MPKQISMPPPAYGSPEWKAERAKMVGTPEWKEATGYKAPIQSDPTKQGGFFQAALPFTPTGTTLTTAQKQAQSPLYNPLYDPSSVEYRANLIQSSNPNYKPLVSTMPQIQNPLTQSVGTQAKAPTADTSNLMQAVQNQNQTVSGPVIKIPDIFQQNVNATPSTVPPSGTQGIKMPAFKKSSSVGSNWGDLFSVAQNRYTR